MSDDPFDHSTDVPDEESLVTFLERELGPVPDYDIHVHEGGHSNETLFVRWGDSGYVVRRPPSGETAETAHDVLREFRVMDSLRNTEARVPTTISACRDESVIGSEFYVMERVTGDIIREEEPDRFSDEEHRYQIGAEMIDALCEIHTVDYDAVGLNVGEFGYPEGFTERQIRRWEEQLDWATEVTSEEREIATLDDVAEWLYANLPANTYSTLIHGDYKLDNVVFAPGSPPSITAVLDWEMSTLGDPLTDLGWLLTFWSDEGDEPLPDIGLYPTFTGRDGYMSRGELVDRYESVTEFEFSDDRFYRALALYKAAAIFEMFYRRHLEGDADDPLYPLMEAGVPQVADRAVRIIEGDEPL